MITDDIAKRFQGIFVADPVWGKVIDATGTEIPLSSQSELESKPKGPSLREWTIYPNPGRGMFTLETDQSWDIVTLYDLQGRSLIVREDVAAGIHTWDLSLLQAGVYLLQAEGLGVISYAKIIVTKAP
ncbi:MAG: T9SS type A sorting domain-containing protein, partial [Bacteroidota bacterium]